MYTHKVNIPYYNVYESFSNNVYMLFQRGAETRVRVYIL